MKDRDTKLLEEAYNQVNNTSGLWLLRHELERLDINKEVQPKPAIGAVDKFAAPGVYATTNKNLAIAWGLVDMSNPENETAVFSTDPFRMILFKGKPRYGEKVYLYKMPMQIEGQKIFNEFGGDEYVSKSPVRPISEEIVNVDDYLYLLDKPTKEDIALWNNKNNEL